MKSLVSLVQMVAELIREKKWVELICLILAVIIVGWVSREPIKSIFGIQEYPQWFIWGCLGLILLFCVAVLIAVFNKPKLISDGPVEEQVAIKGLRPFTQKDAEVFSKLERNKSINACLSMLQDREFRIGILWGESGCGKSSFIQAGLMSKLTTEESQYRGIYIKFSDKNPLEKVKKEIIRDLKLNIQEAENLDFLGVCEQGIKTVGKPLILFFDQFEQVFVHRYKFPDVYEQFLDSLKQWYEQDQIDVKILMCLRSDLFYFQSDIQHKLDYPLYSSNSFELKKFSAEEATNILETIAKIENIDFERDYIKYLFETNFMGKDTLISPVDLQILSLVISSQKISEKRAFKKTAMQKIGEVEGLLYQYLEEQLKLREKSTPTSQTEKLMKVLLEFVDGNELTRSGALTIKELQEKLKIIPPQEISEAIKWLALERLITPIQQEEKTAYELAHEKMIPAVMKLSGKILPKAYKANDLLNKKVRVWMENNYSSRYLLGIRELWLIESHKRYLIWGNKERQKQKFLQQSKRRLYRNLGILGTILLLLMTGWGLLHYTTPGQLWQIRQDLAYWSEKVRDDNYQSKAAIAFAKNGEIKQMKALLDEIDDSDSKAWALTEIAEASSELSDSTEAVTLLKQALTLAQQIDSSHSKARALRAIAEAYIKLSDSTEAVTLLKQALTLAQQIYDSDSKAWALTEIAEASSELSDSTEAVTLLKQALTVAQQIDDSDNKARALRGIAEASSELSDSTEAVTLLKQALTLAQQIDDSDSKAWALGGIAEASSELSDSTEAVTLLKQALTLAQQIDDSDYKAWALGGIAEASSKLSDSTEAVTLLKQALTLAQQIDSSDSKAKALTEIAEASSELSDSTEAVTLLKQALTVAQQIDDSDNKARALRGIAQASSKLSDSKEAVTLLQQALTVAQQIDSSDSKAKALTDIAEAQAKLQRWGDALHSTKQCPSHDCRVESLSKVLTVYAELKNPELKEEES
ncbi:tetratricopeptide repeat protein [Crocosphaera sp.]|uniref:tetratricopeptide repeat protein n=1 Tax=Crocosphaera sp. TaxID=2729996 RepID=UPI00261A91D7|nr:tetratricopeptide repeat protein [Crocosphaera sp.]MDJ0582660.1 tetratricopeptide repeat protein [Crocosphaera sp.]